MIEFKLPSLGEGIEKGTIISILVKEGDTIEAEQSLIEVETDKVVVEVPAEQGGTIAAILVNIGDEIGEGTLFMQLNGGNSSSTGEAEPIKEEKQVAKEEESKPKEEPVIEEPAKVAVAQPVVASPPIKIDSEPKKGFRASPLARKMAKEIGVNLANISLEGRSKRISLQDVKTHAKQLNEGRNIGGATPITPDLPDFSKWGDISKESLSGISKATSENMSTSWSTIPHAWLQEKVDITALEAKRQEHKFAIKEQGGSLTITSILVKVVAKALESYPIFNASFNPSANEIIYKEYINIGVAVDTDRGLLVPGLRSPNQKSISEIAIELTEVSTKVKGKKISKEDLEGITFTISNLGGIGTTAIFPLVTFPQVAILGVAASKKEAVWIDGEFKPRLLMPITIGFDHRIINGADAARFIKHIKGLLEDWFLINL
ncbi:dihydrolipoamide acetyltransferase family protein [uncultured Maribacter sp.]|uniref:dihydrolipoamide acetyltransferase family protein n=1 Tax=uncultured Maribacter sp. TaxID=431308 RepID=UPI00262DEF77|nr:dihydrolipoamide acetyltransferase family protein [uncultured Maribacter sp.]